MPRQKLRFRKVFVTLRQDHSGPLVVQHPPRRLVTAVQMLAEYDLVAIYQYREGAEIKHLVVQGTQGYAFRHNIGTVDLEPLDLLGFESDGLAAESQVVTANAAAVLVTLQSAEKACCHFAS